MGRGGFDGVAQRRDRRHARAQIPARLGHPRPAGEQLEHGQVARRRRVDAEVDATSGAAGHAELAGEHDVAAADRRGVGVEGEQLGGGVTGSEQLDDIGGRDRRRLDDLGDALLVGRRPGRQVVAWCVALGGPNGVERGPERGDDIGQAVVADDMASVVVIDGGAGNLGLVERARWRRRWRCCW